MENEFHSASRHISPAPGAPGHCSPWTSGAKTGIGRALDGGSEVSFTVCKGILNEVYFPREDIACIRECGVIITDEANFYSDERTDTRQKERTVEPGVPAYLLENSHNNYRISKEIITDPCRDTVLQHLRFRSNRSGLHFFLYLTPHLHNQGADNEAWIGDYKGISMLFARSGDLALAFVCDKGWKQATVGFIGVSDGLTELRQNRRLTRRYDYASKGNVQLCAEPNIDNGELTIAIGFGHTPEDAAHHARASLLDGFTTAKEKYIAQWASWHHHLAHSQKKQATRAKYIRQSAAALRIAESRRYPGGIIASLSIPWGQAQGVNDGLGYHLVWSRDLVESAWAFMALNASHDALRILNYLWATQDEEGKWSQNMWLDGRPYLSKIQMDQVAMPVLLLSSAFHSGLIDKERLARYLPGLRKAIAFILRYGPFTEQDRWEQQPGLSVFTIATQIAGLLAASTLFQHQGLTSEALYCREIADHWNACLETWTYVRDTEKAKHYGIDGYYIRINPTFQPVQTIKENILTIKHHPDGTGSIPVGNLVCIDALALVRFGLRSADDPRILNTIRIIDAELRQELPQGPAWRRFNKDAYGEDDAGKPFGKTGVGRSWPLLTGERAHYELAAGNHKEAKRLLKVMEAFSSRGLFPEQVWDGPDLPDKGLFRGQFTGSAMPLTWAQAEYIKLAVSLKRKTVFDMPIETSTRYLNHERTSPLIIWRFDRLLRAASSDSETEHPTHLRIEVFTPAAIRWTADNWISSQQHYTVDNGLGIHFADLPLKADIKDLSFTFYWLEAGKWEGRDFTLHL